MSFIAHNQLMRSDAEHYARNRGIARALSTYRAALHVAIREGRTNDAGDLALKIAHLSPTQLPPTTYIVQYRYYGPTWITAHNPRTCKALSFPSRHDAETFADTMTHTHTRVRGIEP